MKDNIIDNCPSSGLSPLLNGTCPKLDQNTDIQTPRIGHAFDTTTVHKAATAVMLASIQAFVSILS